MMFERSLKPGLLQHRQLYQENEDEPLGLSMSHKQDPQLQVPQGFTRPILHQMIAPQFHVHRI